MARRFDASYVEHATLPDGTPIVLRLVAPQDKEILRRGFEKWSAQSRYTRFLVPKQRLSDAELAYLCEVDQEHHFALGAVRDPAGRGGEPVGLGIARFIRLPDHAGAPVTAEAAIAVADEVQHQGLGRMLFERLVAAAVERGIEHFRCEVLCSNPGMKQLIERIAPSTKLEVSAGVYSIDFALPQTADERSPMYRLLRAAARGEIEWTEAVRRLWRRG